MLCTIIPNVTMLYVLYAECCKLALYAEFHYAECHYAECLMICLTIYSTRTHMHTQSLRNKKVLKHSHTNKYKYREH